MSSVQTQSIEWLVKVVKNCPAEYTWDSTINDWVVSNDKMFLDSKVYDFPFDFAGTNGFNGPAAIITPTFDTSGLHSNTEQRGNHNQVHDYLTIQMVQEVVRSPERVKIRNGWIKGIQRRDTFHRFFSSQIPENARRSQDILSHNDGIEKVGNHYVFKILVAFHTQNIG